MRKGVVVAAAVTLALVVGGAALVSGSDRTGGGARLPGDEAGGTTAVADPAQGARLFGSCAACHSIGRGGVDLDGPNLYGVVGSPVAGRRPRYAYSAALRRAGGLWTAERLDAWLTRPAAFAPGTNMAFAGLPDPKDRADVIAFLATQQSASALP